MDMELKMSVQVLEWGGAAGSRSSTDTLAVCVCPAGKKQVLRRSVELATLLKRGRVAGHRLGSYADLTKC